jgi:hypothetical protein
MENNNKRPCKRCLFDISKDNDYDFDSIPDEFPSPLFSEASIYTTKRIRVFIPQIYTIVNQKIGK